MSRAKIKNGDPDWTVAFIALIGISALVGSIAFSRQLRRIIRNFEDILEKCFQPVVPAGLKRARWTCSCGDTLYDDFKDSPAKSLEAFTKQIHKKPSKSQAHYGYGGKPISQTSSLYTPEGSDPLRRTKDNVASNTPAYLDLCIQSNRIQHTLVEVEVNDGSSDHKFFERLKAKYEEFTKPSLLRRWNIRQLYGSRIVKVTILNRFSVTLDQPSPSLYEYRKLSLEGPVIPPNVFMHYFNKLTPKHDTRDWVTRVPLRMTGVLAQPNSSAENWGLEIVERYNQVLIENMIFLGQLLCGIGVVDNSIVYSTGMLIMLTIIILLGTDEIWAIGQRYNWSLKQITVLMVLLFKWAISAGNATSLFDITWIVVTIWLIWFIWKTYTGLQTQDLSWSTTRRQEVSPSASDELFDTGYRRVDEKFDLSAVQKASVTNETSRSRRARPRDSNRRSLDSYSSKRQRQRDILNARQILQNTSVVSLWNSGKRDELGKYLGNSPEDIGLRSDDVIHQFLLRAKACVEYVDLLHQSIQTLQARGLIYSDLTFLAITNRPHVAQLTRAKVEELNHMRGTLSVFRNMISESTFNDEVDMEKAMSYAWRELDLRTNSIIWRLARSSYTRSTNGVHASTGMSIIELAIQLFDVAILSHIAAHVFNGAVTTFSRPFSLPLVDHGQVSSVFTFAPKELACAAGLLANRRVCVLQLTNAEVEEPLYISTTPESLALVWGPMWKIPSGNDDKTTTGFPGFRIGGGIITRTTGDNGARTVPSGREVLCHWQRISTKESLTSDSEDEAASEPDSREEITEEDILRIGSEGLFTGNESLLLGAAESHKLQWTPCQCSIRDFEQYMRGKRRLHPLRTRGMFRYIDARQAGITAGYNGFGLSGNLTYKTDKGQSFKEGLLEEWENDLQLFNPEVLEDFKGVLVSACTMNAQRVRIVELLKTNSMLYIIRNARWSDRGYIPDGHSQSMEAFLGAIKSDNPFALADLWISKPKWQQDFGNALLCCMRALVHTGYDDERKVFNVLWMSRENKLKRLELDPQEHSWVTMLKEHEDTMSMAVLQDACLSPKGCGCGEATGRSRLETAIFINSHIKPRNLTSVKVRPWQRLVPWRSMDRTWRRVWDVRELSTNTSLGLGSVGSWRVVVPLTEAQLLLKQDSGLLRAIERMSIAVGVGKNDCHWEYTTDISDNDEEDEEDDNDETLVRPIPVHVL